ncbi:MAG: ATP-binding protein [Thermodesulfobacteriota bacterium]
MALTIIFLGVGIYLDRALNSIIFESIDEALHTRAEKINSIIEHGMDRLDIEFAEAQLDEYFVPYSGHYYQILHSNGSHFWKSPSLAEGSLPDPRERIQGSVESFYEVVEGPKGEPVRLLTRRVSLSGWNFIILAGDDISRATALANSLRTALWYSFPLVIIVTIGEAFIIVVPLLRSVKRLSREVEEITEKNLDRIVPVEEMDSEIAGLSEAFNTTFRRLEEALLLRKKSLANASYELIAPLSIIRRDCEITLEKERSTKRYRETIEVVYETVARMPALVERILDVARSDLRGIVLKKELLDLSLVVRSVCRLISPLANEKGVTVCLHGAEGSLEMVGDKERLRELFMHLIENGVKYNRRGGTVEITCTTSSKLLLLRRASLWKILGWIEVSVADTGVGIPENERENIFRRFHRVDWSRGDVTGAGLGLGIAKTIIDAHKGRLDIKSELGKGSRFTVHLPVNP